METSRAVIQDGVWKESCWEEREDCETVINVVVLTTPSPSFMIMSILLKALHPGNKRKIHSHLKFHKEKKTKKTQHISSSHGDILHLGHILWLELQK